MSEWRLTFSRTDGTQMDTDDTIPPDPWLDRITRIAQELIGSEGALLTTVDGYHHVIRSASGDAWQHLAGAVQPRDESLCRHVIEMQSPLIVRDASRDLRIATLPAVVSEGLGSYLGVPIRSERGIEGVLCAVNHHPCDWTDTDLRRMQDLASVAARQFRANLLQPLPEHALASGAVAGNELLGGAAASATHATGVLTPRERQVLELVSRGLSNRAIAQELGVGVDTVKTHVSHVLRKLGAPSRSAAMAEGIRLGLLAGTQGA